MSAIANLVIFDGETTPVEHTFKPIFVRNENGKQVAFYREDVSGVPLDAQPITHLSQEVLKSGVTKLNVRVVIPVMESVSGQNSAGYTAAPKVAYSVTAECTVFSPSRATKQQRKNMRFLLANALLGSTSAISPATYSSGAVPELLDSAISPT